MQDKKIRCEWINDPLMADYHDREWGVPLRDDRTLFEFMILDAFQAGLSWSTVLKKRDAFRRAFSKFDPKKVSRFGSAKIKELLTDEGIIRNRLKIEAAVANAKAFLEVQKEFGTFAKYIWRFVGGKPIVNRRKSIKEIPPNSKESDMMSRDLKKRGFKFVGSTICYAFMQAAGLVNDHTVLCYRYKELAGKI